MCHLPGRDVLDPPGDAARRLGVRVEVHDEGPVGWQFEPGRSGGGARG